MTNLKFIQTLTAGVALATALYPQAWAEEIIDCYSCVPHIDIGEIVGGEAAECGASGCVDLGNGLKVIQEGSNPFLWKVVSSTNTSNGLTAEIKFASGVTLNDIANKTAKIVSYSYSDDNGFVAKKDISGTYVYGDTSSFEVKEYGDVHIEPSVTLSSDSEIPEASEWESATGQLLPAGGEITLMGYQTVITRTYSLGEDGKIHISDPIESEVPVTSDPVVNNASSNFDVSDVSFVANSEGFTMTNLAQGRVVDALRKQILRAYSQNGINESQQVTRYYDFTDKANRWYPPQASVTEQKPKRTYYTLEEAMQHISHDNNNKVIFTFK